MSRESKRRKLEQQLDQLERDYMTVLGTALNECRSGRWGLFGHNDHLLSVDGPAVKLTRMGESIRGLRSQLGMVEEFQPYDRFLHYRSLRGPNVPGEPRLAEALSLELTLLTPTC